MKEGIAAKLELCNALCPLGTNIWPTATALNKDSRLLASGVCLFLYAK
ncbi:hypothetical protein OMCYN_01121 [cyanobiont of Ornithocercus magnificus]|nr:hypothetical protein OMCYN_01121 [cyanobiont of Ornithocercus magnificus]